MLVGRRFAGCGQSVGERLLVRGDVRRIEGDVFWAKLFSWTYKIRS